MVGLKRASVRLPSVFRAVLRVLPIVAVHAGHGLASAQLINGSFEDPDVPAGGLEHVFAPGWSQYPDGTIWVFDRAEPSHDEWPAAIDGSQYVDIGNDPDPGSLQQSFSIESGAWHVLSWYSSTATSVPPDRPTPYRVWMEDALGNVIATGEFEAHWSEVEPWRPESLSAEIDPGQVTVHFLPLAQVGDHDALIDLVTFSLACRSDLNGDTVVDSRDFLIFLGLWAQRDPDADWDGNGVIDTRDFTAYLNEWVDGC